MKNLGFASLAAAMFAAAALLLAAAAHEQAQAQVARRVIASGPCPFGFTQSSGFSQNTGPQDRYLCTSDVLHCPPRPNMNVSIHTLPPTNSSAGVQFRFRCSYSPQ
jgi:hypothetical protein